MDDLNVDNLTTLSPFNMTTNNGSGGRMAFNMTTNSGSGGRMSYCDWRRDSMSWYSICVLIISILGLAINGCLLAVILRRRYLRNLTNVLLVNLTVSDMVLFVSTVPFLIESDLHPCWQFGVVGCKIINAFWVVAHSGCMFTLTALAVERYCAVTSRAGFRSNTCALASIWILAVLLSLPVLITAHMPYEGVCMAYANDHRFARGYITCHVILTFVVPLTVAAVFYIRMARALVRDKPDSNQGEKSGHKGYQKRKRLAAIVLLLVVLFGFCWTPLHLWNLFGTYGLFHTLRFTWRDFYIFYGVQILSIYLYLFLNPVVVFIMSPNLRKALFSRSCCDSRRSRGKLQVLEDDESHSDVSEIDLELKLTKSDEELGNNDNE